MGDTILVLIGLGVAVAIVLTGGFGLLQGDLGFGNNFFGSGPLASGPGRGLFGLSTYDDPAPAPASNSTQSQKNSQAPIVPGQSVYSGRIQIENVFRSGSGSIAHEYVSLRNRDSSNSASPINITGWSIENSLGNRFKIGGGYLLPFFDKGATSIQLEGGAVAYLHTGRSPIGMTFRENRCTGYLNEVYSFSPSLSQNCPTQDVTKMLSFTDACIRYIENNQSSCRQLPASGLSGGETNNECANFIQDNFNYNGCVNNFRQTKDFSGSTWQVYLDRNDSLWRSLHDAIILRDANGLVVSTYIY